ncbi:hypothetical protein BC940DRAFT_154609 [Gongronella butleri]|nr:hypothetical protein BC940DRAFT_154609 [Gongronella butleri]
MEKPPVTFSNGWYSNFAKRYELTRLVMHGEGGSAPDIESVREQVDEIREKLCGVPLSRVYNIDETGLCYMQAPRYTIASNTATAAKFLANARTRLESRSLQS